MTTIVNNAAYIIKRINDIWDDKPGKKALQKIVYLIEQKNIDLGYEYGLHFYGPYSGALDADTFFLSADGIIEFHYSGSSHLICIDDTNFEVDSEDLTGDQIRIIDELINRFRGKTASELELLTTAIYAYNHLEDKTEENIIQGVQKIKGSKYSREQILRSMENFEYFEKPILH